MTLGISKPPLSPTSLCQTPTHLQRSVEGDVFNGSNAHLGTMYRRQGRPFWGRAVQFAIVNGAAIGGGGVGG